MKKINTLIGILIIFIGCWIIFFNKTNQPILEENINITQENPEKNIVFLIIDNGDEVSKSFEAEFIQGATVFDVLKNITEELNTPLETQTYDSGIFIESIDNKKNGQDEKYWMYYINGRMAVSASDKHKIEVGDTIEFKFEKSPF
jgi:hypothetical protein